MSDASLYKTDYISSIKGQRARRITIQRLKLAQLLLQLIQTAVETAVSEYYTD
jgi:hypothetical protein